MATGTGRRGNGLAPSTGTGALAAGRGCWSSLATSSVVSNGRERRGSD